MIWLMISAAIAIALGLVGTGVWFFLRRSGRVGLSAWSDTMLLAENERAAEYAEFPGSAARTL
jgi:hypothetical protein